MKQTPFGSWAARRKLAFGLLTRETKKRSRDRECIQITARNLVLHNGTAKESFLQGPELDAMLSSAFIAGYDYILVQAQGHYLLNKPGLADALEEEMKRDFFVLGHILDKGPAYFTIHDQCLCVNLNVWEEIGRPIFGAPAEESTTLHRPLRSVENFHGEHTPIWIAPSGQTCLYPQRLAGWNFVNVALDAGVRISPFSRQLRRQKGYLYPEHDDDYYFLLGDHRRRALNWGNGTWVANTEDVPCINSIDFAGPISTIISVASGLNTYILLERLGYERHTAVHYVDVSAATLAFKRWLLHNWDGNDYVSAVARWRKERSDLKMQRDFSDEDVASATAAFAAPLGAQWAQIQRLPHYFHELDLLTSDCDSVISLIDPSSTTILIWWSNVFHSHYTHSLLSAEANAALFRHWMKKIRARNPNVFIIGKNHLNESLCGRVRDIEADQLPQELPTNLYYPPEILNWFAAEQGQFRMMNRK